MLFSLSKTLLATSLAASFHYASAGSVCRPGQMAVGSEYLEMFTGPNRAYNVYAGFLMANDCKLISQNDATQDKDALCGGGYYKGASVTCDSNHLPVAAVDTHNQHWRCSPTTDSGCNVGGSGGRFYVQACCDRA